MVYYNVVHICTIFGHPALRLGRINELLVRSSKGDFSDSEDILVSPDSEVKPVKKICTTVQT